MFVTRTSAEKLVLPLLIIRYSHCANPETTLLAWLLLCDDRLLLTDACEVLLADIELLILKLLLLETPELLCDERLLLIANELLLRGTLLIELEDLLEAKELPVDD